MKLSFETVQDKLQVGARLARRYIVLLFLLFMAIVYGFLAFRILSLNQAQPDQSVVTARLKTAGVPHIDQDALTKIKQLQDNSVEVQSLFDSARSNPFQE